MIVCPHCGRDNDKGPTCADCGKPLPRGESTGPRPSLRPEVAIECPHCGHSPINGSLPFCPNCGKRLGGSDTSPDDAIIAAAAQAAGQLLLLDDAGVISQKFPLTEHETTVGRTEADICFADDPFLSPVHAQIGLRNGEAYVRDLGSRNGTWAFVDGSYRLQDGDAMLIGSQVIRFRRLGYPGPNPPEADATRRLGSLIPSADIASLTQLRADGSARDTMHLSPGRTIRIGRERGDWLFPYDPSMSGAHCQVRSADADFLLVDDGSRNGVAVRVRGEVELKSGGRVLVGDKMLKLEIG